MYRTINTRPLTKPLFCPNKFVFSFIKEFDAFLFHNPDVKNIIGVTRYKSRNRKTDIAIDFDNDNIPNRAHLVDFNDTDIVTLFVLKIYLSDLMSIEDTSLYDILNYSSSTSKSEKDHIERQWLQLIGNDSISHASLIYTFLHYDNIPKNIAIPLIKDLGIETCVIQDKDLAETDFISKYDGNLFLPIVITANNFSAISKFLSLINFDAIKSDLTLPNGIRYFCRLDNKSLITIVLYYLILKKKYSEDYSAFLTLCNFKELFNLYIKSEDLYIEQLYYPSLKFLYILSTLDEYKYILLDRLFNTVHYDVNYENSSEMIEHIIKYATVYPEIVEVYKHYCSRNGLIPNAEIITAENSQNQIDPREEFLKEFKDSYKDNNDELHLGLKLEGEQIYDLYNVLKDGYIDASQISIYQFCYAITGVMRPEKIEQIVWLASTDEFAILVNMLFLNKGANKPQTKICKIFTCKNSSFKVQSLTSRCCRVESKRHQAFFNRIKTVLKFE